MIRGFCVWAFAIVALCGEVRAEETAKLDFDAWKRMPVLHDGRIKPLDSFARTVVRGICGRESPKLGLPEEAKTSSDRDWAEARKLFPDGEPRKFAPEELLFSWMVEPEKWERVPFIVAGNEELRREALDVKVRDSRGNNLQYVSPYQVAMSMRFVSAMKDISKRRAEANSRLEVFKSTELDNHVNQLNAAYATYRLLAFDPLSASPGVQSRFRQELMGAIQLWMNVRPAAQRLPLEAAGEDKPIEKATSAVQQLAQLSGLMSGGEEQVDPAKVEPLLADLREAALALAAQVAASREKLQTDSQWTAEQKENALVQMRAVGSQCNEIARLANEAQSALYDTGQSLQIVPALNAAALEEKRDPSAGAQPWLSLQSVLLGSDLLLKDYPQQELKEVREAFRQAAQAYVDREASDRPEQFSAAMNRFAEATFALGEAIEPLRQQLPIKQRDEELMAATAYPPVGKTDLEVFYNRLDPFTWTWVLCLAALVAYLAMPLARHAMFWTGTALLVAGQAFTVAGLTMRIFITGRAPVTNMFETIVFVALVVAMLGVIFSVVPLLAGGFQQAWRWTALPRFWEFAIPKPTESPESSNQPSVGETANYVLLLPRVLLMGAVFWLSSMVSYGATDEATIVRLTPRVAVESTLPTFNDMMAYGVGLAVLGLAVWLVPRVLLTMLLAIGLIPASLRRTGLREPLEQVVARKPFALSGAAVAFLAAYIACNAAVFDKNISPIMPVLRNNFWLVTHVLTITASYGAGALAWGLANLSLGYYLFGSYRNTGGNVMPVRQPPEFCGVLSTYMYRAMQIAVVLLVAGTILGALWADVSWGRFWGWDSKEVWALISSLVYLALLHGRYSGMFADFGMAVGSVFGATSILLAWYGVNYIFGTGLHSYGTGTGGQLWVYMALAVNWVFVAAAGLRYLIETTASPTATGPTGPLPPPTGR